MTTSEPCWTRCGPSRPEGQASSRSADGRGSARPGSYGRSLLDALTGAVDMPRPRLLELLRSTLVALARTRPTVLVVEDLHWSDKITRDTLAWLLAMTRD